MTNLMESSIPELFSRGLDEEKDIVVGSNHTEKVVTVIFEAVSKCLHDVKSKDYPVAFAFEDLAGDTLACAIVSYHESEDKNEAGNWSYVWSFEKADIPEGSRVIKITDTQAQQYFITVAGSRFNMGFESPSYIIELSNYFFKVLNRYLEDNVTKDTNVEVGIDGVFQARAGFENGEIVKSIEPAGELKTIVKGDAQIEAA